MLTGSADNTCRLWDCETGRQISVFETKTAVRSCGFASSSELIFITTDKQMGHECEIMMFDMSAGGGCTSWMLCYHFVVRILSTCDLLAALSVVFHDFLMTFALSAIVIYCCCFCVFIRFGLDVKACMFVVSKFHYLFCLFLSTSLFISLVIHLSVCLSFVNFS